MVSFCVDSGLYTLTCHDLVIDEEHQARRRYKKDLAHIKPDLVAYNKQKALALGVAPDALKSSSSSSALTAFDPTSSSVRFNPVSFYPISFIVFVFPRA